MKGQAIELGFYEEGIGKGKQSFKDRDEYHVNAKP